MADAIEKAKPIEPEKTQKTTKTAVAITSQTINIASLSSFVADDAAGAIATFVGTTRDSFQGKRTLRLEYEAYEPMAVRAMEKICDAAAARWELAAVAITHRVGVVEVREASVAIAASSAHRRDALEAVSWAIDELKATVPIWKKEFFVGGGVWKENEEGRRMIEEARRRKRGEELKS